MISAAWAWICRCDAISMWGQWARDAMRCDSAAHAHAMRCDFCTCHRHHTGDAMRCRCETSPMSRPQTTGARRYDVDAMSGGRARASCKYASCKCASGSKADQGLLAMRCDSMSQCPAMSADLLPRRCDAISIAGHTSMSDDAIQSDEAQAAMTSDVDVERKRSDVRFMSMCPDIAKPMNMYG